MVCESLQSEMLKNMAQSHLPAASSMWRPWKSAHRSEKLRAFLLDLKTLSVCHFFDRCFDFREGIYPGVRKVKIRSWLQSILSWYFKISKRMTCLTVNLVRMIAAGLASSPRVTSAWRPSLERRRPVNIVCIKSVDCFCHSSKSKCFCAVPLATSSFTLHRSKDCLKLERYLSSDYLQMFVFFTRAQLPSPLHQHSLNFTVRDELRRQGLSRRYDTLSAVESRQLSALPSLLWHLGSTFYEILCFVIFNIRSKGALLQEWHTLAQQIPSFIALGTRNKHEQAPSITVNRNKSHPNSKRDFSFRSWMLPIPWGAGFSKPCDGQSQTHVLTWQCISSPHKICCRQPTVCVSEVQN